MRSPATPPFSEWGSELWGCLLALAVVAYIGMEWAQAPQGLISGSAVGRRLDVPRLQPG